MANKHAATPAAPEPPDVDDTLLDGDDMDDEGDEGITEVEIGQLMHHPNGYYWITPDGKQEFGPFDSVELALADMQSASEESAEPGETLREAEDEIGVADWIDPDTGALAEGQSTPHFRNE
ncbi:hypothetical protein [Rhodoferax sp. AJA081-3]|uniref:hypothetical protein n=1 Tax=Rhodoferax sp. AJA081-3 TaxID=2752316 RepID=UPI001FD818D7|nr:hypothetical protein [Rhodoferax sp. AJA081-3]